MAACGNGSLRLFDLTLEVSRDSWFNVTPGQGVISIVAETSRAYPRKSGMNMPQRLYLSIGIIWKRIPLLLDHGIRRSRLCVSSLHSSLHRQL